MISSEDVIGSSVCTLGRLGGVSPAHISQIDLPQRQTLVPRSPAASVGPADGRQGETGERCVDKSCRSLCLGFVSYSPHGLQTRSNNRLVERSQCEAESCSHHIRCNLTSALPTSTNPKTNRLCSPTVATCDLTEGWSEAICRTTLRRQLTYCWSMTSLWLLLCL